MAKSPLYTFSHWLSALWHKLGKTSRSVIACAAFIGVTLSLPNTLTQVSPSQLKNAELYFATTTNTFAVGQTFPVELRVRTGGTSINAMGFTVVYNPLYLEVMNMTVDKSFCTFYLENSFSNTTGLVKLSCGTPAPGFQGDSLAVRLLVRAKLSGEPGMVVDPDSTMLLANDGKGSNIVVKAPALRLSIQQL